MSIIKKLITFILIFVVLLGIGVFWCNITIKIETNSYISDDINELPTQKVGLLLGTAKLVQGSKKNYYFYNRIEAAEELYKSGKIKYIIVSGDNSRKDYNEPEDMKQELMEKGVPEYHIFEDFAGFRTLDSVIRAKEIFGQNSYIIISQKFHNERAVYLARKNGINAYGYNAKDVNKYWGFKTNIREYFAKTKVFVDFITGKTPKFGGQKIKIPDDV